MVRVKISSNGGNCAQESYCFPLGAKQSVKKKWIEENDLFIDRSGRVFALVDTVRSVYFMDAITGTLYQLGESMSCTHLKIDWPLRDIKAKDKLLKMRANGTVNCGGE